jgi:hypothetical protein
MHGDHSLLVAAEELRFLSPLCSGDLPGCSQALRKASSNGLLLPRQTDNACAQYQARKNYTKAGCHNRFALINSSRAAVFEPRQKLTSMRLSPAVLTKLS